MQTKRTAGRMVLACGLALLMAPAAIAADEQPRVREGIAAVLNHIWVDCRLDLKRHCKGVAPGEGRLLTCMQQHRDQLNSGCRTRLDNTAQAVACWQQIKSACAGSTTIGECLATQQTQAPACAALPIRRSAGP